MKNQINIILLILAISLGLGSCSNRKENKQVHIVVTSKMHDSKIWKIYNYVSPMGTITKEKFITTIDSIKGFTYISSDTLPTQGKIYIDEKGKISLKIVCNGMQVCPGILPIFPGVHWIDVTDKNGYDFLLSTVVYEGEDDRLFFSNGGEDDNGSEYYSIHASSSNDAMYKILAKGGKIILKITVRPDLDIEPDSRLIIKNADGFEETFNKIKKDDYM